MKIISVKSSLLFYCLIIFNNYLISQDIPFFEKGSTWYYDASTYLIIPAVNTSYGILRLRYTKDTIIDGEDAVFIEEKAFNSRGVISNPDREGFIMRQEGMKIYLHTEDGFQLYFNFDAVENDTIKTSTAILPHTLYDEETEFNMVVDSVSKFQIDDQTYPEYYFNSNLPDLPKNSKAQFKLGIANFSLIFPDPLAEDYFYFPKGLRCYEDSSIQFNLVNGLPCGGNLITNTKDVSFFEDWKVFPNPVSEIISILNPENNSFNLKIMDIQGKVFLEKMNYYPGDKIDINALLPGYYQIIVDNKSSGNLRFVKN